MKKTGVLLINLGTPDNPSTGAVRKYLTQFLNDPRVIDINPIGRFFLVNFIIVPFRSSRSAKLYKSIWTDKGSPLLIHGNNLKHKLQEKLGSNFIIELGMRYQKPSIGNALRELLKHQPDEIIVIPLYPQYATSSTASSIDELNRELKNQKVAIPVKVIKKFFDEPGFISAWVEKAKNFDIASYDHIIFSYHGLPERQIFKASEGYCQLGSCCDVISKKNELCYRAGCLETTRQLVKALHIPEGKYTSSFQSRLDDKWLKPYSDKVIADLAKSGKKKILVFSPAFVADCLETIHEIGTEYKEIFLQHGGEQLDWIESLNSDSAWVEALVNIVKSK